jgi:hypothetical protein
MKEDFGKITNEIMCPMCLCGKKIKDNLRMTRLKIQYLLAIFLLVTGCVSTVQKTNDFGSYAQSRKNDLQLGVYITAHTVQEQFSTEAGCRESISVLRCNGFSKVYVEVYRPEMVVPTELLKKTVSLLEKNGFEVVGGIATLPGEGVGVAQQGPLTWFNWQNPKTQTDLRKIVEETTPLFKTFILDDFFCTADTSLESKTAKGDKTWSEYRRSMLTEITQTVFINPAKAKNPDITMIIKYPQWYDRFHQFGYDVATEPALFDKVYVGTETRGQYTQRYGFVQPYEGFINYRWISTLAGNKICAAWFDHGDCNGTDFIEQAYQSVLAGAKELVIFNFGDYLTGHPGHHLLRQDFEKLADLAAAVAKNPVVGAVGYKPANSDAGADLYIMDYIGMFGISLVPDSKYPENASVLFLPTQAATDSSIVEKVEKSLNEGKKIVVTAGFLARAKNGEKLAQLAGISYPLIPEQISTQIILNEGKTDSVKFPLQTDYRLVPADASVMLETAGKNGTPFLIQNKAKNVAVINTHTFSQADFDAVGEVLLCPRQLGLLELPKPWVNQIRSVFNSGENRILDAPSRVTWQQLGDGSFMVHNYNQENTTVVIDNQNASKYFDGFDGEPISGTDREIRLNVPPRSRVWLKPDGSIKN